MFGSLGLDGESCEGFMPCLEARHCVLQDLTDSLGGVSDFLCDFLEFVLSVVSDSEATADNVTLSERQPGQEFVNLRLCVLFLNFPFETVSGRSGEGNLSDFADGGCIVIGGYGFVNGGGTDGANVYSIEYLDSVFLLEGFDDFVLGGFTHFTLQELLGNNLVLGADDCVVRPADENVLFKGLAHKGSNPMYSLRDELEAATRVERFDSPIEADGACGHETADGIPVGGELLRDGQDEAEVRTGDFALDTFLLGTRGGDVGVELLDFLIGGEDGVAADVGGEGVEGRSANGVQVVRVGDKCACHSFWVFSFFLYRFQGQS